MLSVPLQITSVYDLQSCVKLEVFWTFTPISMHEIVFFPNFMDCRLQYERAPATTLRSDNKGEHRISGGGG